MRQNDVKKYINTSFLEKTRIYIEAKKYVNLI